MASADSTLAHLDEGEAHAITLALERRADLLLIDERDGTAAARARGLTVTRTLGVLESRRQQGIRGPAYHVRPITGHDLPFACRLNGNDVGAGCPSEGA
jgi:predicted nucleic acid-binding protein